MIVRSRRILTLFLSCCVLAGMIGLRAGAQTVEKYRNTGADDRRLVIAITGDGYTSGQQSQFRADAVRLVDTLLATSPWDTYAGVINIYFVGAVSNQSGADKPPLGVYVDTIFDGTFYTNNMDRLLTVNTSKAIPYVAARVPSYDTIFILVNDTMYGGSGGTVAVTSLHSLAPDILIHEVGHSFASLADEYVSYSTPYTGSEPWQWNVTKVTSRNTVKWKAFIQPTTPVPTVPQASYQTQTGLFEGAYYYATAVYRPNYNCEMRALGVPFCPVCKEAHASAIHAYAPLVDSLAPASGSTLTISDYQTFSAAGTAYQYIAYQWQQDGVNAGNTSSITLSPADVLTSSSSLSLTVKDATPLLVNRAQPYSTYNWTLLPGAKVISSAARAKEQTNGKWVTFPAIVSGVFTSSFYVQDSNRAGGIRVLGTDTPPAVGKKITLTGLLDASGPILTLTNSRWTVDPAPAINVKPLGMNAKLMVGRPKGLQAGTPQGRSINNVSLLIKIVGIARAGGASYFYIDDPSGIAVKVNVPSGVSMPAYGKLALVTGICSFETGGADIQRVILVRGQSDIQ